MDLKNFVKDLTPNSLKSWLKHTAGVPNQVGCFKNLKQLGFSPKVVLDIGAYEGLWAKEFKIIYPLAKILMFEAQPSKKSC